MQLLITALHPILVRLPVVWEKAKRCISIPDFLYDDIHKYISKLYGIEKEDRIFYFTKAALEKEIKRAAQKAGLPPIRVHDLRHSHASMLIELGFTPLQIADRLGHESVKTTLDTYSHLSKNLVPIRPDRHYHRTKGQLAGKYSNTHKRAY